MNLKTLLSLAVWIFLVHRNPIAEGQIRGLNPTGSTGCSSVRSSKFCWRYCSGGQGNWCYTSRGCSSGSTSCASLKTCGGISCQGAGSGCVQSCAQQNHLTSSSGFGNARKIMNNWTQTTTSPLLTWRTTTAQPTRLTKPTQWTPRFTFSQPITWAPRLPRNHTTLQITHHKVSTPWYTPPTKPTRRTTTPRSTNRTTFRQQILRTNNCLQFTENNKLSSNGKIITWYKLQSSFDSRNTSKNAKIIATLKKQSTARATHTHRRSKRSYSLQCSSADHGALWILQQHMRNFETQVGPGLGQFHITRPGNHGNPVLASYQRRIRLHPEVFRVEILTAVFHERHYNRGNRVNFPTWTMNWMRDYLEAQPRDVRFHLALNHLSGPAELYNMVPGHPSVNNNVQVPAAMRLNDWRSTERAMAEFVRQGQGRTVEWTVGLSYDSDLAGRPTHFTYVALFRFNNGITPDIRFIGSSLNQQLPR